MPESLAAFHARVDGFSARSLPQEGSFATSGGLTAKVAPDGRLLPYFGNTVIFGLPDTVKLALCRRQAAVYHRAGWLLADPLAPEAFHITLHDLVSGPEEAAIAADAARTEAQALALLEALRQEGMTPIRMVSTHVFSMASTSLVTGFAPETEADCTALMTLYERFQTIFPLPWGLTPHVTLGYYRPGHYGPEAFDALNAAIRDCAALPPIRLTLTPESLHLCRFTDMNHYSA